MGATPLTNRCQVGTYRLSPPWLVCFIDASPFFNQWVGGMYKISLCLLVVPIQSIVVPCLMMGMLSSKRT